MPDQQIHLSDQDIERIADRVYDRIYADLGRSVIKKALWPMLAASMAAWVFLSGKWPFK